MKKGPEDNYEKWTVTIGKRRKGEGAPENFQNHRFKNQGMNTHIKGPLHSYQTEGGGCGDPCMGK